MQYFGLYTISTNPNILQDKERMELQIISFSPQTLSEQGIRNSQCRESFIIEYYCEAGSELLQVLAQLRTRIHFYIFVIN